MNTVSMFTRSIRMSALALFMPIVATNENLTTYGGSASRHQDMRNENAANLQQDYQSVHM